MAIERDELTVAELDQVSGGMDEQTRQAILNVATAIPVVGVLVQTGRAIGNMIRMARGDSPV